MVIPDLLPPAEIFHDTPSADYLDLLNAQVDYLERKSGGLLSGRARAEGLGGTIRFEFLVRIPKITGFEVVLFAIERDPSRPSGSNDLDEVRSKFADADVVRRLRNMYSIALSSPGPDLKSGP